jgi:hypothetical protein
LGVGFVKAHPKTVALLPPFWQAMQLRQVPAGAADNANFVVFRRHRVCPIQCGKGIRTGKQWLPNHTPMPFLWPLCKALRVASLSNLARRTRSSRPIQHLKSLREIHFCRAERNAERARNRASSAPCTRLWRALNSIRPSK